MPDLREIHWWDPFRARGRNDRVAVQHAGEAGLCPVPATEPCECGQPRKATTP